MVTDCIVPEVQQDVELMSEGSEETSMELTTPNTAIFEFKHQDTDSEGQKSPAPRRKVEIEQARKVITMKSVKHRTSTFFEYDEEKQEKILQQIIDSAVLDPDWLRGHSDSEHSLEKVTEEPIDKQSEGSEDSGSHDLQMSPKKSDKEDLRQLIQDAERLVKERSHSRRGLKLPLLCGSNSTKHQRIRQWLATQRQSGTYVDSCDASSELTTGDSDSESNTSDKGFGSKENASLLSSETTPIVEQAPSLGSSAGKVVLRGKKRRQSGQRPWSYSEMNPLPLAQSPQELRFLRHTFGSSALGSRLMCSSESALNHLKATGQNVDRSSMCNLHDTQVPSASETLQKTDSGPAFEDIDEPVLGSPSGRSKGTSSLRKRKSKLRRRSHQSMQTRVTASDSGSEIGSMEASGVRRSFTKSPTLSDDLNNIDATLVQNETVQSPLLPNVCVTEEDDAVVPQVTNASPESSVPSPRGFIFGPPCDADLVNPEDPFSSLSEQAWDPYQDQKYASEQYSEDLDQDAAKRLLEFGDDYRNFIDSDGSSFVGIPPRQRRLRVTRPHCNSMSDSDHESDSLRQVISESRAQYEMNKNILQKYANQTLLGIDLQAQVISTADTNLTCLRQFVEALQKEAPSLSPELKEVQELIQQWETLKAEAESRQLQCQELKQLEAHLAKLRDQLHTVGDSLPSLLSFDEDDSEILDKRSREGQAILDTLYATREDLVNLNVNIHQFITKQPGEQGHLVENLTALYQEWDLAHKKVSSAMERLEAAKTTWNLLNQEIKQLKQDLKQDSDTLKVLDQAMQCGNLDDVVTNNAEDVSRLLNDRRKQAETNKKSTSRNDYGTNEATSKSRNGDDAPSDSCTSGYESCSSDDLSERERRLANLKKLAKELEATLLPGSKAWMSIIKAITDAECELQALQQQCRKLFVKTAETLDEEQIVNPFNARRRSWCKEVKPRLHRRGGLQRSSRRSLAWRVVKAAVPFQAVMLLMLCVACLLEPQCCDNLNTYNLNFNPQLRFLYGPPPV